MTATAAPRTGWSNTLTTLARFPRQYYLPAALMVIAGIVLFQEPARKLASMWWSDPDAGHGLLLFPLSLWLAWKTGLRERAEPSTRWGIWLLCGAIFLRALGGLAAELYTQRFGLWLSFVAIIIYFRGWKQIFAWWLPVSLTFLSVPFPDLILNQIAIPLQFVASKIGNWLMLWRGMPVVTEGNIMLLTNPETHEQMRLFVAEACSGLRSMTALIALSVAIGGMYLRLPWSRVLLVILSLPIAIILNAIRVFLTSYLIYYVSREFGEGFLHHSAGWGLFSVAMVFIGIVATIIHWGEKRYFKGAAK